MSSAEQIRANASNARLSTGPRSPEGKSTTSANAIKHGILASRTVIPGEDPAEFEELRTALHQEMQPAGPLAACLLDQIAGTIWRLRRLECHEAALIRNALDPAELLRAHEAEYARPRGQRLEAWHVPVNADVEQASLSVQTERQGLARLDESIRLLEKLSAMPMDAPLPSGTPVIEGVARALDLRPMDLEQALRDHEDGREYRVRDIYELLSLRIPDPPHRRPSDDAIADRPGFAEGVRREVLEALRAERPEREAAIAAGKARAEELHKRYDAAIERRRQAATIPPAHALENLTRYESSLRRGLLKLVEAYQKLNNAPRGAQSCPHPALTMVDSQACCSFDR